MAEISEFVYAYFTSKEAIVWIKHPKTLNRSFEHKPNPKVVFCNLYKTLSEDMGVFSHNHIVYMVGGFHGLSTPYEYDNHVYMFDPTQFEERDFPVSVENIEQLPYSKFAPMVDPFVIQIEVGFYLLTITDRICKSSGLPLPLHFQYFDPTYKVFETWPPPPPYPQDCETSRLIPLLHCYFLIRGYIYLSIRGKTCMHTFKFNTMEMESKWEDCNAMLDTFQTKRIRFPFGHFGNVGISYEFADKTWILVFLNYAQPTAYYVTLHGDGYIVPISSRVLAECKRVLAECKTDFDIDMPYSKSDLRHLSDMGGGRFCVMCISFSAPNVFVIYVFSIDFSLEYEIQTSQSGVVSSSIIIFSMKFNSNDTICNTIRDTRDTDTIHSGRGRFWTKGDGWFLQNHRAGYQHKLKSTSIISSLNAMQ
ncbi:PREDICTED: uncharacterized protein LOC109163053 [Ipomoea nil]|uniref:uncharacterized protein LOC109163053 n=1 Tax=Ipomoea nil TaxID=35883 RepID=UPI0009019396|nr:PREDICTED: uncharacterized protein LOC109163053 [Ipomoea nil]